MAIRKNVDPKKKETPKKKEIPGEGAGAKRSRDSKGNLVSRKGKNFAGVSQETLRHDAKVRAKTGDRSFDGAPASRVGGVKKLIGTSGPVKGGTKSQVKASKKRVNKSAASPAAKRSAKRLY